MFNERSQKDIEYLILLLLSTSKEKQLSHLHIQKEIFLLSRESNNLNKLFDFIKHYRGPYSEEIKNSLFTPMYLDEHWEYDESNERINGGEIRLTETGLKKGKELIEHIRSETDSDLLQILTAMQIVHDLYDDLDSMELLYYVYREYESYTKNSEVYDEVMNSQARNKLKRKYKEFSS